MTDKRLWNAQLQVRSETFSVSTTSYLARSTDPFLLVLQPHVTRNVLETDVVIQLNADHFCTNRRSIPTPYEKSWTTFYRVTVLISSLHQPIQSSPRSSTNSYKYPSILSFICPYSNSNIHTFTHPSNWSTHISLSYPNIPTDSRLPFYLITLQFIHTNIHPPTHYTLTFYHLPIHATFHLFIYHQFYSSTLHQSTSPSIHQLNHPHILPLIHLHPQTPFTHSSIHLSIFNIYPHIYPIHPTTHPSVDPSIHAIIHPYIHPFTHPSTHPRHSSIHSFIHLSVHSPTHPSTYSSIHLIHLPHSFSHPSTPFILSSIHSAIHPRTPSIHSPSNPPSNPPIYLSIYINLYSAPSR